MYGLAYVIIPTEFASLQGVLDEALAPFRRGEDHAFPTAIVLPVGAVADEFRWFDALGWRPIPSETKAFLSVPDDVDFKEAAVAAYERFHTMAAAGVTFHF